MLKETAFIVGKESEEIKCEKVISEKIDVIMKSLIYTYSGKKFSRDELNNR